MAPNVIHIMTFMHKLNLYVDSVLEKRQIRLYESLLRHIKDLLGSIGILSTGHLPHLLFPPVLQNITSNVIAMVHKSHPDYVWAIDHLTEYYDMNLATFGVDTDSNMIVAFQFLLRNTPISLRFYMKWRQSSHSRSKPRCRQLF